MGANPPVLLTYHCADRLQQHNLQIFRVSFYVFGSCSRMLAVILVSDFFFNGAARQYNSLDVLQAEPTVLSPIGTLKTNFRKHSALPDLSLATWDSFKLNQWCLLQDSGHHSSRVTSCCYQCQSLLELDFPQGAQ